MRAAPRMIPGLVWFGPVSPDLKSYRAVYISEYLFRATGYTAKQWLETPGFWASILHPEDREQNLKDVPAAMAAERPIGPYRILAGDARVLWLKSQLLIERDAAGVPVRMRAELAAAFIRLGIELSGVTTCASLRAAIAEHGLGPRAPAPADRAPAALLTAARHQRK